MIIPRMITRLKPINGITPFTYRNGLTYLEILERISKYIQEVLVGEINEKIEEINKQQDEMVAAFKALMAATTAEINQLISDTKASLDAMESEYNKKFQQLTDQLNQQIDAINALTAELEEYFDVTTQLISDKIAELNVKIAEIDERLALITWLTPGPPEQRVQLGDSLITPEINRLWSGWPIEYVIKQDSTGINSNFSWPPNVTGPFNLLKGSQRETRVRLLPDGQNKWKIDPLYSALQEKLTYKPDPSSRIGVDATAFYNSFPCAGSNAKGTTLLAYGKYETHFGGGPGLRVVRSTAKGDAGSWVTINNVPRPDASSSSYGATGLTRVGENGWAILIHHSDPYRMFITYSADDGLTWGEAKNVANRYGSSLMWYADGSPNGVILATSYWSGVHVHRSYDLGQTWNVIGNIPQMSGLGSPLSESSILHMGGDELLMMIRYTPDQEATVNQFMISRSYNGGVAWTTPTPALSFVSGQPRLTRLPNGDIITPVRLMSQEYGMKSWGYAISKDNGSTWKRYNDMPAGLMMYGNFVTNRDGSVQLFGGQQWSTTRCDIMRMDCPPALDSSDGAYATALVPLPLASNVTGVYSPGYRMAGKTVYFEGALNHSTGANPGPITTLSPLLEEWARPRKVRRFVVSGGQTADQKATATIEITPAGQMNIIRTGGPTGSTDTTFYLDSISYIP